MSDPNGATRNHTKATSVWEAVVLVSTTLMMIGWYLYSSVSASVAWPIFFGTVMLGGFVASIFASRRQMLATWKVDESASFRIDAQLNETLKAKSVPADITFGLEQLIKLKLCGTQGGEIIVTGETELLRKLERVFGTERTEEVKSIILKYARVAATADAP